MIHRRARHAIHLLGVFAFACSRPPAPPQHLPAAFPAHTQELWGDLKPVVSVKELMRDMIDPASDFVFDAVGTIVTRKGRVERIPRTLVDILALDDLDDLESLWDAAENLDRACETSHLEYWYPGEKALLKKLDAHLEELFGPHPGTTRKLGMEPEGEPPSRSGPKR